MSVRNDLLLPRAWRKMFLITLLFVSSASALFLLDMFRSYEAEMRILVIGRSAAADPEQTADNLAAIVGTLPFYDRIAADSLLGDPFEGHTQSDRRALWNGMVRAKRESSGSIISISAAGEDPEEARRLSARVSKELFGIAGTYYDVKNAIDMRVIDGPIAGMTIRNPVMYAFASALSGFAATAAFFGALFALPAVFGWRGGRGASSMAYEDRNRKSVSGYSIGDAVPYIDPRKFIPVRPSSLPYEEAYQEPRLPDVPEPSAKASAPDNLPIADTFDLPVSDEPLPFSFEEEEPSARLPFRGEHEVDEEAAKPVIMGGDEFRAHEAEERGEPTVEEYKRRLNELLGGGR